MKNKVKSFLESRGLSAYKFIQDTGIAPATGYALAKDENHLPSIRVLESICDTYKIQPGDLLEWVGDQDVASADALQPEPEQKSRRGRGKSEPKSEPLKLKRGQVVKIPAGTKAWVDRMLENGKVALTVEGVGEDVYPIHMLTVTDLVV